MLKICIQCGQEFFAKHLNFKCCGPVCSAARREFTRRNRTTKPWTPRALAKEADFRPIDHRDEDEAFCAAMTAAGYEMTGPDTTPCTENPIIMDRIPPTRSTGFGDAW